MKIKMDFTTNSSSSSFVILAKNKLDKQNLESIFKELVGVSKLFPNLARDIANAFESSIEHRTLEEFLDDYGYDSVEELDDFEEVTENITEYPVIYSGSFGNDEGPIENLLCDATINYKDNNIIISKRGGY